MVLLTRQSVNEALTRIRVLRVASTIVVMLLALSIIVRIPNLHMPVNRDIFAYATIGSRMSHGELPYRDYFDHKQPLIYLIFWFLNEVAPRSNLAIQLVAAMVAGATGGLLYLLLRNSLGTPKAIAIGVFEVTLGASRFVQGVDLNTEHLLLPLICAAVLVPYAFRDSPSRALPFIAGLLGGIAILAKGVAILILPAAAVGLIATRSCRRQSICRTFMYYCLSGFVPLATLLVILSV